MSRTVKDPDERRSEFITTAQKLFYTKGYEHTSINDIINAMGVSKGAFYHYFDSKQAMLEAVVADISAQEVAQFEAVVADDALSAIQKWQRVSQAISTWKIEQKDELLAVVRVMRTDENVPFIHKLRTKKTQMMVPLLANMISQGIEEGVFETTYVEETAEIVNLLGQALNAAIVDIILKPENYDHPEALARRKVAAWQTTMEQVLGAATGSLPIIDEQAFGAWFAD